MRIAPVLPTAPVLFAAKKKMTKTDSTPTIGLTHFARDRYTPENSKSHFDGSWDQLKKLVEANWQHRKQAPSNSQVFLIPVPQNELHRFYSKTIDVNENTPLTAKFAPRREGEDPYIQIETPDLKKQPAQSAEIVVYSHQALADDEKDFSSDKADYYIVAINAYPTSEPEPMAPMTMARNFLGLPGGTKPEKPYSAEEFARAIIYWSKRV